MAVRRYKPTSPGRRFQTVSSFDEITRSEPERSLLRPAKKKQVGAIISGGLLAAAVVAGISAGIG
jgi:ribosomal protein L2